MKHVTLYSTPTCPYCARAKQLLTSLNVPYEEIDLASNDTLREELSLKYNWQTVPMIVIGDEFIGGFDDLAALHADGNLMKKLEA
ncbi:MAG: glutaredoxin [Candidatus Magasanikbacteria bacterium CG10_big_fil_rev_8_21_14_0_10_47_10]|uniref:Glutaredoxin n=1 Tax=Candidatus Magasanikbacteria bacterium CG10_big_fil_rev_8_21_14_0_10_47_10 TaxID=1974652 RepID=A0A2H0TS91_9BACT|nr:MAG: glutaredoxin [Candidatus Magasanikbacteria bacterium CG10_big_fil_rev_8_21_14_0_10_47_10]